MALPIRRQDSQAPRPLQGVEEEGEPVTTLRRLKLGVEGGVGIPMDDEDARKLHMLYEAAKEIKRPVTGYAIDRMIEACRAIEVNDISTQAGSMCGVCSGTGEVWGRPGSVCSSCGGSGKVTKGVRG